jgi:hypothetical protein
MERLKQTSNVLPPLFEISKAIISNFLLIRVRVSLACSSRCNWAQERSQYAPLKITYIIELVFNFLKITSFRQRQIAQHNAVVPTQIKPFIFLCWLFRHVPNIWPIDPGWFRLVEKKTILQIVLAKGSQGRGVEYSHYYCN